MHLAAMMGLVVEDMQERRASGCVISCGLVMCDK